MPEEPLRVILMSKAYPPDRIDGVGRYTNLIARGMSELGHTVHVVTKGERERVIFQDGAYVHQISYKLDRYWRYRTLPNLHHALNYSHAVYDKANLLVRNNGVQVAASSQWQFDGLITAMADLLPVVVHPVTALRQIGEMQGFTDDDTRLIGDMEECLIKQASFIIFNSLATSRTVEEIYGGGPLDVPSRVIPFGVVPVGDEDVLPFDGDRPPSEPTVLFLGRLEKRKGILALFEAIPRVLEKMANTHFVIAGSDNSRSDGFLARTGLDYPAYFACNYPEMTDRVSFLGWVTDEQLNRLYQSCDLFVAPSLYESFGLIYLEAMNYAKPVIGCMAGGIPEVVDDGITGVLVEPGAAAPLAEAIISLLLTPTRMQEMGLAGRQRLLERFTYIQMARECAEIYRLVSRSDSERLADPVFRQAQHEPEIMMERVKVLG